jgi:hypothetical protein
MGQTRGDPGDAPNCPGPPARQRGPTTYSVPKGAVDTHTHVIGLVSKDSTFAAQVAVGSPLLT